jgi:hypothetical protein
MRQNANRPATASAAGLGGGTPALASVTILRLIFGCFSVNGGTEKGRCGPTMPVRGIGVGRYAATNTARTLMRSNSRAASRDRREFYHNFHDGGTLGACPRRKRADRRGGLGSRPQERNCQSDQADRKTDTSANAHAFRMLKYMRRAQKMSIDSDQRVLPTSVAMTM